MVTAFYDELEKRKNSGEKLDINKLTKEEWKQLAIAECRTQSILADLFDVDVETVKRVREKSVGRVLKDYCSIRYIYTSILKISSFLKNNDISVGILEIMRESGYKEVYCADYTTSYKYTVLFDVTDELEKQRQIYFNNQQGKMYKKTLLDIYIEKLYNVIMLDHEEEYEFNYYVEDYINKKEEFLKMYEIRKKKFYNKTSNLTIPKVTEVITTKKTSPYISQKNKKKQSIKQDYTKKTENQIKVGGEGQKIVFEYEKLRLADHPELQSKIEATYEFDDGAGYDIKSFDEFGNIIYIEVKTDSGNKNDDRMTFYISDLEDEFIINNSNAYIYYVYDLDNPKIRIVSQKEYINIYKQPRKFLVDVYCE